MKGGVYRMLTDQLCRVSDGEKRTGGKLTGNGILKH